VCLWSPSKPQVCVSESRRRFGDLDEGDTSMQVVEVSMQSVQTLELAGRKAREMEEDLVALDDASGT
jgi:hypothetical protein